MDHSPAQIRNKQSSYSQGRSDSQDSRTNSLEGNGRSQNRKEPYESKNKSFGTSRRKAYEVILYPIIDYFSFLKEDGEKEFRKLKEAVGVDEFCIADIDIGDPSPVKVLKVFDVSHEKKWASAFNLLDHYTRFRAEFKKKGEREAKLMIIIPDSKHFSIYDSWSKVLTIRRGVPSNWKERQTNQLHYERN